MKEHLWSQGQIPLERGDAYTVEYYLLVDEVACGDGLLCENYGLRLKLRGESGEDECAVRGVTTSAKGIEKLLNLLVRNNVTPVTLHDVLEDYLAEG